MFTFSINFFLKCRHEGISKQRKERILDRLRNTDMAKVSPGVIKFRFALICVSIIIDCGSG